MNSLAKVTEFPSLFGLASTTTAFIKNFEPWEGNKKFFDIIFFHNTMRTREPILQKHKQKKYHICCIITVRRN